MNLNEVIVEEYWKNFLITSYDINVKLNHPQADYWEDNYGYWTWVIL